MKLPILILFYCLPFFFTVKISASSPVNTEDHPTSCISMIELIPVKVLTTREFKSLQKEERILTKVERRIERIQRIIHSQKAQKNAGIFSDPVGKWFWLWIIGWGSGVLFYIISGGSIGVFLGILLFLAFVVGSISLVVWLVNKFG